jgi:putative phage-type endonuclease
LVLRFIPDIPPGDGSGRDGVVMATNLYEIERYETEADWLRARLTGIGSSDCAAVVGLGRDRGQYAVWAEKTSPLHVDNQFDELIYWGHALEKPIANRFMHDANPGAELVDYGDYALCRRIDKPWHICTPDRVLSFVTGDVPVELKTAHYEQAMIWGKEVPWNYIVQSQWQQHVLGADGGYIAVLCNGRDFKWHVVERNDEIIRRLVSKVDRFWHNHVVPRVAPSVDATSATSTWLGRIYSEARKDVAELGDDFYGAGKRWDKLQRLESKIERHKELLKNRVKEAMGNCELAQLGDGSGFAWTGTNGSRRFTRKQKVRLPDE